MSEIRTYCFIAGMPRAGATLLANLLAQNPRFEVSAISASLPIINTIREQWDGIFAPAPDEQAKISVMRGVLHNYYSASARPVIFDRCRAWLAMLEMLELLLERKAKVLVPVRDLRDILASFEKQWRKYAASTVIPQQQQFPAEFKTLEGRCEVWLRKDQAIGLAYTRVEDALVRGFRDRMHFVRFEALTSRPRETMRAIYDFLDQEHFEHDFNHVRQVVWEDDLVQGSRGRCDIRPKVEPVPPQYPQILGRLADKYKGV